MNRLAVVVRLGDVVVEQRLVRLREGLVFGDAPGAAVGFPHATVALGRDAFGWTLQGHRLACGRPLVLAYGRFEVSFEGVADAPERIHLVDGPDLRMLVATLAVLLLGAAADTVARVGARHPDLVQELRARLVVTPAPSDPGIPDDTGLGAWPGAPDWPPGEHTIRMEP